MPTALNSLRSIASSLRIQWRIISALLMREVITRYGRHNIGFGWMIAEPATFCLGIIAIWSFGPEGGGANRHIDIASYALTGYSTILNWRNTVSRCIDSVEPNRSLLYHRNVMVLDVYFSRIILELGGVTLAITSIYLVFIGMDLIAPPVDLLKMLSGWLLLSWYSTALAILLGALSEYSELVDKIWHPLAYFQLPLSGAMVMAHSLPPTYRRIVMAFPVPNCVELYRAGYYGDAVKTYYDVPYVIAICMVITWLGLTLTRDISNRAL
ncbi:ABC transporter permease [Frateuria aurantia]